MRVEVGDHALHRRLVERAVGDGLDVFAANAADDFVEEPVRLGSRQRASRRGGGDRLRAQPGRRVRRTEAEGCADREGQQDGR